MSTYNTLWGVKIYLRDRITENTTYGLYTPAVSGNSTFRWIEADITNLYTKIGEYWKSGIIGKGDISAIIESADLRHGGNQTAIDTMTVRIQNTINFDNFLHTNGTSIYMCKVEIWEFRLAVATDTVTTYVQFYGIIDTIQFNETDFEIRIVSSNEARSAQLGTLIDSKNRVNAAGDAIGKMIPITFGEIRPSDNGSTNDYARMIRTANATDIIHNDTDSHQIAFGDGYVQAKDYYAQEKNTFPVVAATSTTISVKLASDIYYWIEDGNVKTSGTIDIDALSDYELHVIEGTSSGESRKIESASVDLDSDDTVIEIVISSIFPTTLVGNSTATAENNSWVQIKRTYKEFEVDVWPCGGFIDDAGISMSDYPQPYFYESQKTARVEEENEDAQVTETDKRFFMIPHDSFEIKDSDNNSINITSESIEGGDADQVKGFYFYPMGDLIESYNSGWDRIIGVDWIKMTEGGGFYLFRKNDFTASVEEFSVTDNSYEIHDKNHDTYFLMQALLDSAGYANPHQIILSILLNKPELPENLNFDTLHFGLNFKDYYSKEGDKIENQAMRVGGFRWVGTGFSALNDSFGDLYYGQLSDPSYPNHYYGEVNNIKDDYYLNDPETKDLYFYTEPNPSDPVFNVLTGYVTFEIQGIKTIEQYKMLEGFYVNIVYETKGFYSSPSVDTLMFKLYEACVIASKNISIKDNIYTPMKGRIFNDTWGSRKTAANLMQAPCDIIEHCLRLQNWSETGEAMPAAGWGKAYATTAKIDTSSNYGGFGYAGLSVVNGFDVAGQILTESRGLSDQIVKQLCKEYFLCNSKRLYATTSSGDAGKELIYSLFNVPASSFTITKDYVVGDIGPVIEPEKNDIYCEPFVRFCWNEATGKFEREIRVKNVSKGTWEESYTPGFNAGEGKAIYDICYYIYHVYQSIQVPPSEVTDLYFCYDYTHAKKYLENLVRWMWLRRMEFSVPYEIGREWYVCMPVAVQFPHQTANVKVECIIEKIEKHKNSNTVKIKLIMLDRLAVIGDFASIDKIVPGMPTTWLSSVAVASDTAKTIDLNLTVPDMPSISIDEDVASDTPQSITPPTLTVPDMPASSESAHT